MKRLFWLGFLGLSLSAGAMPVQSSMIKPRAFFQEADNNLLEPLDLKSKILSLAKADFDQCGLNLVRKSLTLQYSCTLPIPSQARISKLQTQASEKTMDVIFGGTKRRVTILASPDARSLTISTAFDSTGIDFEISKFNDDFFKIYDKVAVLIMSEALAKPVRLEVLESRQN